jgi:hypothetical protein
MSTSISGRPCPSSSIARSRRMNSMALPNTASSWALSPDFASTIASATESASWTTPSPRRLSPAKRTPSSMRRRIPSLTACMISGPTASTSSTPEATSASGPRLG